MGPEELRKLLEGVQTEQISVDRALEQLRRLPYEDLGYAKIDHHRHLRKGFPEVIYCQGKTVDQVAQIFHRLCQASQGNILGTRATEEMFGAAKELVPEAEYDPTARMILRRSDSTPRRGMVCVCSAGTADLPVAEEAALTCELMGNRVERIYDTGVAGIHRILDQTEKLARANVVIVVAGMEGALPSVVGGLVDKPVIAVPTSVGYGASFNGLAALLGMLNSCASGVTVVNIDNGFGAGYAAGLINKLAGDKQ
ncbi:1-(5-phosphoribosyl)-5-amino-4-imidazole-carboxylate carboxylase [Desulforamulus profundi]|uniref:1-(5-phosphoribosyl)-5-amino-4-imidazole-carboxylate carboxylase n=1 Tax=Desulforamulus profundi TaxID=1383067 RepID=A0A2C6L2M1_9FIRM|nr:nickel pincer cofactor biosynthesis protein LarB [Desulforamulus profundi]PHJ38411.1 1-(5-phosphoribosyl)-5-amino-4-imidazole-carboxylate carboxylase [Desulforamulus profundi]